MEDNNTSACLGNFENVFIQEGMVQVKMEPEDFSEYDTPVPMVSDYPIENIKVEPELPVSVIKQENEETSEDFQPMLEEQPEDKNSRLDQEMISGDCDNIPSTSQDVELPSFKSTITSAQPSKKSRTAISLEEKIKILHAYDKRNKLRTLSDLARSLKIPLTTLTGIVKNRTKVEEIAKRGKSLRQKTLRGAKFENLEKILYDFYLECRRNEKPISGPLLIQKAEELAIKLNISDEFKASIGWLGNFKKRHDIGLVRICEEENDIDINIEKDYNTDIDENLAKYSPQDKYNFDEIGLFYFALPDSTRSLLGDKCEGGKLSKIRVTVGLCVNQTGSDKIKPIFIAKHENPRCFENINTDQLPVNYEFNMKSWMTRKIFTKVVTRLQHKMARENRKVILIIDNASCHKLDWESLNLQNVAILILHPKTTGKSQPLNKGIVQNVKVMYRRRLVKHYLRCLDMGCSLSEVPKWTLLHAIRALGEAWKAVSPKTIGNCWQAGGFSSQEPEPENMVDNPIVQQQKLAAELELYFSHLESRDASLHIGVEDYVFMDDNIATCDNLDEENQQPTPSESDEEDENDVEVIPPKREDVLKAIQTLHQYCFIQDTDDEFIDYLSKLEIKVDQFLDSNKAYHTKKVPDLF